jgi:propane monooxygenase coupling protein
MTQYTSDRTSSNRAGVTLMNNQVGYVLADVMRGKENIVITELPSMIRVDGVGKVDFDYEEIAEALGWEDFGNNDFEEILAKQFIGSTGQWAIDEPFLPHSLGVVLC